MIVVVLVTSWLVRQGCSRRPRVARAAVRPTISVVIPVRNDAVPLAMCLAALSRQDSTLLEVIVVDNASTDSSGFVAAQAGVTLLVESRVGIATASKTGYDRARGDIIARIDADTVVPHDWASTIVDAFVGEPRVDVITGGAAFTDGPASLR